MKLGFMTAILPDLSLEEILKFAADEGFECIEVMCWPTDASDKRRYAGVTHIDVDRFDEQEAERVRSLAAENGIEITGLGYYPNPLVANEDERRTYVEHIRKVITASARLGVGVTNTFVGRDPARMVEDQWDDFDEVWGPLIAHAEEQGVRVGIENCPMLFSRDEWPGGKNLAFSPEIWEEMFRRIPSGSFGLNFDPSHLVWQQIDIDRAVRDFADRLVHVHLKDERIDEELLYRRGVNGLGWHVPKIPGLGSIDWDAFFRSLVDIGWDGPVVIEVEDRAFEESLEGRKDALRSAGLYLRTVMDNGLLVRQGRE